jgi:two-component system, NarL family, sensor histidine kinase LiaS
MLHAYQQLKNGWKNEMRRPFFFHRLQWKLTRAYLLVTFVLMGALQVGVYLLVMGLLIRSFRSPDFPPRIAAAMLEAGPQFAPHLNQTDMAATTERTLAKMLKQFRFSAEWATEGDGQLVLSSSFQGENDTRTFMDDRIHALILTDPSGKVLAHFGSPSLTVGADLSSHSGEAAERLRLAQSGVTDPARLVMKRSDDFIISAVPIFDEARQQVIGVFWAQGDIAIGRDLISGMIGELFGQLIWVPIIGLVLGLTFGFFTARNLTHRLNHLAHAAGQWAQGRFNERAPEQPNDELGALGERLNQMAAELQKQMALQQQLATMEERNRLALELHDTVKQQLFACAMQISAAQRLLPDHPAAAQRHLQESETLAKHMQDELTAVIQELLPADKQTQNLAHSLPQNLEQLAADWTRQTGIPVALQLNLNGHQYTPIIERTVLRIVQEAFANIARHSAATAAELRFEHVAEQPAQLTISDDGKGFELHANQRGVGLQSMRERAASLPNGTFTLTSNLQQGLQQGTRIVVQFNAP